MRYNKYHMTNTSGNIRYLTADSLSSHKNVKDLKLSSKSTCSIASLVAIVITIVNPLTAIPLVNVTLQYTLAKEDKHTRISFSMYVYVRTYYIPTKQKSMTDSHRARGTAYAAIAKRWRWIARMDCVVGVPISALWQSHLSILSVRNNSCKNVNCSDCQPESFLLPYYAAKSRLRVQECVTHKGLDLF